MSMQSARVPHTAQGSLRALGVPWQLINLPLPYLWLLPQTSDPDTAGVIEIVSALQRGLAKIGFGNVRANGTVDQATALALTRVAGNWKNKTWMQIINDVVAALTDPERATRAAAAVLGGLGDYIEYDPQPGSYGAGPLPGLLVGTPPGPLGLGDTATDSGATLTWTPSGTACTPSPKKSGTTYAAFSDLQRQINRLLSKFGGGKIAEDGIIGKGTVAALQKVGASLAQAFPNTCAGVAGQANTIRVLLKGFADSMGIPAAANKPSTGLASVPVVGAAFAPPSDADSPVMAAVKKYGLFFGLAAGVAFFAARSRKGKTVAA